MQVCRYAGTQAAGPPTQPSDNTEGKLQRVRSSIGDHIDFSQIRYPQEKRSCRYDDLPTFPPRPNFAAFENALRPASQCVVYDGCPEDPYHPSNTPIYQTATFVQPSSSEFGPYDYTRSGNPTRTALEKHVAMLEHAAAAFAFSSGMAALHTVTRLLKQGDDILVNEDIYGGMHRLLTQESRAALEVRFVDTTNLDADLSLMPRPKRNLKVAKAILPTTRIIHTAVGSEWNGESPSNPRMRITDLRALAKLAHQKGVLLSVDSTMMPPVICQPLLLGVDIVVHSATKFFSGHADCTGGLVCVRDPELAHRVAFLQNAEGTALAPFECFLFLRGIKTMWLRVSRAQENAQEIAKFLSRHPKVTGVFFPGPGGCDNRALRIHQSQSSGPGCVISFTTGSVGFSRRLLDASRLFKTTVMTRLWTSIKPMPFVVTLRNFDVSPRQCQQLGTEIGLGEMPCTMSHASIPAEQQTLPQDLVRLSVGIEDVRDLLLDLQRALETASGQREQPSNDQYDSRFEDLPVVPRLPGAIAEETDGHDDPSGLQRSDSLVGFLAAQAQQKRPGLALLGVAAVSVLTLGALAAAKLRRRCAGFIAGFGFDVTVMVRSILLRGFDQDIANMIGQYMQKHGVNFAREMVPSKFEKTADGKVKVFVKDAEYGVFDTVLVAIGRTGLASQLNVEAAGLSYNPKTGKVVVDDNDQTSVPNIFAIGDVCEGKPELTPVAIQAGRMLTRRLFAGSTKKMDYTDIATTVFTPIEYGCVGYSEDEAREKISKDRIKVYHCTAQPLEWNLNSERKDDMGYMKLIVDKEEKEKVVGVHILGPNAGEIIQGLSVAIRCGVTKEHFDDCVGIHPTYAESYTTMTEEKTEGSTLPTKGGC
eukprot:s2610_g2.t1